MFKFLSLRNNYMGLTTMVEENKIFLLKKILIFLWLVSIFLKQVNGEKIEDFKYINGV